MYSSQHAYLNFKTAMTSSSNNNFRVLPLDSPFRTDTDLTHVCISEFSQLLYSQLVLLGTQGNNGETGWSQADNEYPQNYSKTSKRKKCLS